MVSQHWCRGGVMHSWCCDSVMQQWRLRYPPSPDLSGARCQDGVSTPWALHGYGQTKSWFLGHVLLGLKAPRFKGNKHQKEHPKSSMGFPTLTIWHQWSTFCLIVLDPIWNYPCCYWLFSEVPNPTKHVCPWMKTVIWGGAMEVWGHHLWDSPMASYLINFMAPSRRQ